MKKRVLVILIPIVLLFIAILFYNVFKISLLDGKSDYIIENELISMKVKSDTLTNTGARFIIYNNSEYECTYGNPFTLEKKENGSWYKMKNINDLVFNMPAFSVPVGGSVEMNISWEVFYGALESGTYRIVKDVTIQSEPNEEIVVAAEFTIE